MEAILQIADIQQSMSHPITPPVISGDQLGHLLRGTRKRLKLTQAEIAARLNLSQNRISYLELHPDELSVRQLLTWCSVLGLQIRVGTRNPGPTSSEPTDW